MANSKNAVIYFRGSLAEEDEKQAASKYFDIVEQRTLITAEHDLVIPRYSALPYYEELEKDVNALGSKLLNTHREHRYVANIRNWYHDLAEITPMTWFFLDQIPQEGPFVLKGETNSKKFAWNTHMFAKDKAAAINVYMNLANDGMIGDQDICVRQFVPLKKVADNAPQGLPVSEEYRFFVLDGKVISKGFYWSTHWDDLEDPKPDVEDVPQALIDQIIKIVSPKIRFFVFDVARCADDTWILIELNDGQQSGLSMNDPDLLYKRMREHLDT